VIVASMQDTLERIASFRSLNRKLQKLLLNVDDKESCVHGMSRKFLQANWETTKTDV